MIWAMLKVNGDRMADKLYKTERVLQTERSERLLEI
jgi:hypothetical protein